MKTTSFWVLRALVALLFIVQATAVVQHREEGYKARRTYELSSPCIRGLCPNLRGNSSFLERREADEDGNEYDGCSPLCSALLPKIGTPRGGSPAPAAPATRVRRRTSIGSIGSKFWERALSALNINDAAALTTHVLTRTEGDAGDALFTNDDRDSYWPVKGEPVKMPTSRFATFGNEALQLGISHLSGCTFLVIVGPQGVWMAHYWEAPGFSNLPDADSNILVRESFRETVLDHLNNGYPPGQQGQTIFQHGLAEFADQLTNSKVFIMHPLKRSFPKTQAAPRYSSGPNYPAKLRQLKNAITAILPDAQFLPEYLYRTTDIAEELDGRVTNQEGVQIEVPFGRGLFEYDPDNGNGVAEVRVLFEDGGEQPEGSPTRAGGPWHFQIINNELVAT